MRWNKNSDDDFEYAGNSEDEFWAEYAGEADADIMPDANDYDIHFREQELEIANKHLNTELLDRATSLARSTLFWCFLSAPVKLRMIEDAYHRLLRLVTESRDGT